MAIRPITKEEFDKFKPARGPMVATLVRERVWYVDDAGNIIGTVFVDLPDDEWNFVILGRDEHGRFRAIEVKSDFGTRDNAVSKILEAMSKIETSEESVFPQGDEELVGSDHPDQGPDLDPDRATPKPPGWNRAHRKVRDRRTQVRSGA